MTLMWILVGLAALDAEHLWLPNALTLPGALLGFVWWLTQEIQLKWALHIPRLFRDEAEEAGKRLLAIFASAALILLIRWIYWLARRREGIGLGDAKLMALLAAWLGLPGALFAFGLGAILGAAAALALLVFPSARRESEDWSATKLPLGTFLCIGGIVSCLWGQQIIAAYLLWSGL
jgi:leader peptidase (prepilin peptidase)/N-methyltransferase